jgi:hypothetical protein
MLYNESQLLLEASADSESFSGEVVKTAVETALRNEGSCDREHGSRRHW